MRLVAEEVTVRRAARTVLDRISLSLAAGSFVAVLGPNGAGKSTLLACLAGLVRPDGGGITLDAIRLDALPPRQLARRRAYLPQSPRAEWPIPVERLVALGLMPHLPLFGSLPPGMGERVERALAAMDLLDRRDQPATTLSGGELARAMFARAIVGEPALLIADEPLAGLDPRHALDGVQQLRERAAAGTLVIASLHDLTLAARYASHVVMLRKGRLIAFGPIGTTLTSQLVSDAFDVAAHVTGAGGPRAMVDLASPHDRLPAIG